MSCRVTDTAPAVSQLISWSWSWFLWSKVWTKPGHRPLWHQSWTRLTGVADTTPEKKPCISETIKRSIAVTRIRNNQEIRVQRRREQMCHTSGWKWVRNSSGWSSSIKQCCSFLTPQLPAALTLTQQSPTSEKQWRVYFTCNAVVCLCSSSAPVWKEQMVLEGHNPPAAWESFTLVLTTTGWWWYHWVRWYYWRPTACPVL